MLNQTSFKLTNSVNGNIDFQYFEFDGNSFFNRIQRNNYFSLIWVTEGSGTVKADFSEYDFKENSLFALAPYQPFMISSREQIKGIAIYFHADFFCIHKHHKEVTSNGVLYNNVYQPPFVAVDESSSATLKMLCEQIKAEMQNPALAQYELLVSYLKIFLITAARLKKEQMIENSEPKAEVKEPYILQKLKDFIEANYKEKHSASEYAELLNITPKALAKITKNSFNKTITDLISERIIIEAKRELYMSDKLIKEIAFELGYPDEYYFSRFFKKYAEVSPQAYRDTVGFARAVA